MYCNKCGKKIPDGSQFCPACGAKAVTDSDISQDSGPSPQENPAQENPTQENPVSSPKDKRKKTAVIAAVVLAAALLLVYFTTHSRITANNVSMIQLYNTELGVGLKLNMPKSEVDKLLGTPESDGEGYYYPESCLYTTYREGKLISMCIGYPNDRWITERSVTIKTPSDQLREFFGEPLSIEHDDRWWHDPWWYYCRGNIVTGFEISRHNDDVMSIYIYDESKIDN